MVQIVRKFSDNYADGTTDEDATDLDGTEIDLLWTHNCLLPFVTDSIWSYTQVGGILVVKGGRKNTRFHCDRRKQRPFQLIGEQNSL